MNTHRTVARFRISSIAACLAVALGLGGSAASAGARAPYDSVSTHARAQRDHRPHDARAKRTSPASVLGGGPVIEVPSCSEAALRTAVAGAADGDTVSIPMNCSLITLTAGAIPVVVDNLTLSGPGADAFTLDGGANLGQYDRVFRHTGVGVLQIDGMTIANGSLSNSMEPRGGCVDSDGVVMLSYSTVTHCAVDAAAGLDAKGGALYGKLGARLYSSAVTHGTVHSPDGLALGGAVFSGGALDVMYSTVSDSTAAASTAGNAFGGGIYTENGDVEISASTISGNQADRAGGLFVAYDGLATVHLTDSTVSGNQASEYVGGAFLGTAARISNSTVVSNSAGSTIDGIGVYAFGSLTAQSSIFSNNLVPAGDLGMDIYAQGGVIAGEKNIIVLTPSSTPGDTSKECPRLGPLADNGGPTLTHALLSGSPAIDAGSNPLGLQFDQRQAGFDRTFGTRTDVGAVEWQGQPTDTIFTSRFEFACD